MHTACRVRLYGVVAGFFMVPFGASAQGGPGDLVTDRPDQTESSAIVPPGFAQLELGWTYVVDGEGVGRARSHSVPGSLLRIGVTRKLEARVGFSGWTRAETGTGNQTTSRAGFGDVDVGAKYRVFDGTGLQPDVAFVVALTLPTGGENFGADRALPLMRATFAHELSEQVGLGYNVGVAWSSVDEAGGGTAAVADLLYSVVFGFALSERLGAFAESFGNLAVDDRSVSGHSVDAGFTFRMGNNLQFDVATGVALNDAAEDWFFGAGFSVRVPR